MFERTIVAMLRKCIVAVPLSGNLNCKIYKYDSQPTQNLIADIFKKYVSVFTYPLQANVFHVFTLWGMFLGIAPLLTKAIALSAMMAININATKEFGLVIEKTLSD